MTSWDHIPKYVFSPFLSIDLIDQCRGMTTKVGGASPPCLPPSTASQAQPARFHGSLAQNVFPNMHERWYTTSCNGGLKWQIFTSEAGYDYKNSISNGLYSQLGTRLAKLTGSLEYITEAEQAFE
jgi:hypothetical protein